MTSEQLVVINTLFKTCTLCGLNKPLERFPNDKKAIDGKHTQCSNCRKEIHRQYRIKRRTPIIKFKLSNPCAICGEENISILDFHHIDPKEKKFKVSLGYFKPLKELKQEIAKCIIICHSCHSKFHHYDRNPSKTPKGLLEKYKSLGIWLKADFKGLLQWLKNHETPFKEEIDIE